MSAVPQSGVELRGLVEAADRAPRSGPIRGSGAPPRDSPLRRAGSPVGLERLRRTRASPRGRRRGESTDRARYHARCLKSAPVLEPGLCASRAERRRRGNGGAAAGARARSLLLFREFPEGLATRATGPQEERGRRLSSRSRSLRPGSQIPSSMQPVIEHAQRVVQSNFQVLEEVLRARISIRMSSVAASTAASHAKSRRSKNSMAGRRRKCVKVWVAGRRFAFCPSSLRCRTSAAAMTTPFRTGSMIVSIADNATAEGRLQNRRVSLHVSGGN
jgi:hypothetical protein